MDEFHWTEEGPHVFTVTPTGGETPGRTLTTEVRYPRLTGSRAASQYGPFPVIVFAHGFDTLPSTYTPLLDSWVRAGFVVVSPIFPDENALTMAADGAKTGQDTPVAEELESDIVNEPGDLAFVLHKLFSLNDQAGGALKGVLAPEDVALAGQSDGGNVVGALAFSPTYARVDASLPVAPKAVAILSGTGLEGAAPPVASSRSPALLQIQSDADGCVSPVDAIDLFSALQDNDPHRWFVILHGARHLGPYVGVEPYASVVEAVTTDFFKLELNWHATGVTPATLQAAATASNVSTVTTTVNGKTMPVVPPKGTCENDI